MANCETDGWDWYEGPGDDVLTLPDYAPYAAEDGAVLVAIAVLSTEVFALRELAVGVWETRGLGDIFTEPDPVFAAEPCAPGPLSRRLVSELPSSIDLTDGCPPVRDQGNIGSCAAFATTGAYDYELGSIYNEYGWDFSNTYNLTSPKWVYRNTGSGCGPASGRTTWMLVDYLETDGTASELNCPYMQVCDTLCTSQECYDDASLLRIDDWSFVFYIGWDPEDVSAIKQVLADEERVVVMRTQVDNAIFGYQPGTVWNYTGPNIGGHAMVVVGYDDAKEAFKVRNSWGADWGDQGYLWIGYQTFMNEAADIYCCKMEDSYEDAVAARFLGLVIITGFSPSSGITATEVTITGYNFGDSQGGNAVYFTGVDGATEAVVTGWSDEDIAVLVPHDAVTGPVWVSINGEDIFGDTDFTVLPHIDSLDPAIQHADGTVEIDGSGFGCEQQPGCAVRIGQTHADIRSWNNNQIVITVPREVREREVTVTVPAGTSNGVLFTPKPRIASLTPGRLWPGNLLTIDGYLFGDAQGGSAVIFAGGVQPTPEEVLQWCDTQILVLVPAGAQRGDVVVTVDGIDSDGCFLNIVLPPPELSSLGQY